MWDGLLLLLLLSIVMGGASFLAGTVPLSFTLSARQMRLLTALGTGILVGTSLIIIIPEGVETLYSTVEGPHTGRVRSVGVQAQSAVPETPHLWAIRQFDADGHEAQPPDSLEFGTTYPVGTDDSFQEIDDNFPPDDSNPPSQPSPSPPQDGQKEFYPNPPNDGFGQGPRPTEHDPHVWVGVSLILGFVLMYLIDTLPQTATAMLRPQRFHVSLGNLNFNRSPSVSQDTAETPTADTFPRGGSSSAPSASRPSSTTTGLVIHAVADGIALGASSAAPASSNLSFIIFLALMIHKAPAAFGLTSVLLKQGLTKRQARYHLIVFSLAAPAGALLTWLAIHIFDISTTTFDGRTSTEFATGVLLLFSGGTFLYVAMHTMQENGVIGGAHGNDHSNGGLNGYAGVPLDDPYASIHGMSPPPKPRGPAVVDTFVTVGGMLLPLLMQWGHTH